MPSHLSAIGFQVETQEDFLRLAEDVTASTEELPTKWGSYLRWTGSGGEELWLQLDSRRDLIGMNPHFSGSSRVRVGVVARVARPDDTSLDGALHAWASPRGASPDEGDYPFVFDVPDIALYPDLAVPGIAEAQIAAFAHAVAFFRSEQEYDAAQGDAEVKFAARSFIPSGLFSAAGNATDAPAAEAIFTGIVLRTEVRTNPISKLQFWWALVETLGGQYDVVIDPVLLEQQPAVGGILSGSFWLSGRLLSHPRKQNG